LREIPAEIVIH